MDNPTRRLNSADAPDPDRPTQRLAADEDALRCPHCHTVRRWALAQMQEHPLVVAIPARQANQAPNPVTACHALACPECGYTEFYLAQPQRFAAFAPQHAHATPELPLPCPRCQGARVWATTGAGDRPLTVSLRQDVGQVYGWQHTTSSSCLALACPVCGYTEFYLEQPARLVNPWDVTDTLDPTV